MPTRQLPVYFIHHGAGPWPWLDDTVMPVNFKLLAEALRAIPDEVGTTPKAILLVSAHWEESEFTMQTSAHPPMLYDYYGFPQHTYEVDYPAPGSPEVAARAAGLLTEAGLAVRSDAQRGFDHGTFVPLHVAYPDAQVPVFQMSLREGLDPAQHLAVGRALAPLRDEDVLIVCSGVPSYHNMRVRDVPVESKAFDDWLNETLVESSGDARLQRLLDWEDAPHARLAHPREEHFIPGLVAVGAAGTDAGYRHYHEENVMGWLSSSSYRFGGSDHDQ